MGGGVLVSWNRWNGCASSLQFASLKLLDVDTASQRAIPGLSCVKRSSLIFEIKLQKIYKRPLGWNQEQDLHYRLQV
jgi:hypothetical protein